MQPPVHDRIYTLPARFSREEYSMMVALAKDLGVDLSDVVRMALRAAYRERFGAVAPPDAEPRTAADRRRRPEPSKPRGRPRKAA